MSQGSNPVSAGLDVDVTHTHTQAGWGGGTGFGHSTRKAMMYGIDSPMFDKNQGVISIFCPRYAFIHTV